MAKGQFWCVVVMVFLTMDPTWASISSATQSPQYNHVTSWKSSFMNNDHVTPPQQPQKQHITSSQFLNRDTMTMLGSSVVGHVMDGMRQSLLHVGEDNTFREWFRWSIKGSEKIDEEDMTALEIVFLTLFVFTLFAALMIHNGFRGYQIMTVMVFGVTCALICEMYVIAYLKGDIDLNRFNLSRVVAHSPGAIFGVVIAMMWLLMPLMELTRDTLPGKSEQRRKKSRFVVACIIALLLALVTFEPELPDEATTIERIPHYIVFALALILIVFQTALVFQSVTHSKVAWYLPAIVMSLICFSLPGIMVYNALVAEDKRLDSTFWLGVIQLSFILVTMVCWILAAFMNRKGAVKVVETKKLKL